MDMNILNEKALETLDKGNWYDAQQLFRKNANKNPSLMTFNNLGVFYLEHGMELSNGKVKNAEKLGLRYLKKATSFSKSYINLMAIGKYYASTFSVSNYLNAEKYYQQAYDIHQSADVIINLAATLFMQKKYEEANEMFEKVLCDYDIDDQDTHRLSYAFSLTYSNKNLQRIQDIIKCLRSSEELIDTELLALAYLNEDIRLVEKFVKSLVDNYPMDISITAMAVDCLVKLNKQNEAESLVNSHIKGLKKFDDHSSKNEMNDLLKLLNNSEKRSIEISNYQYFPAFIPICHFIGCKKHNPILCCQSQ